MLGDIAAILYLYDFATSRGFFAYLSSGLGSANALPVYAVFGFFLILILVWNAFRWVQWLRKRQSSPTVPPIPSSPSSPTVPSTARDEELERAHEIAREIDRRDEIEILTQGAVSIPTKVPTDPTPPSKPPPPRYDPETKDFLRKILRTIVPFDDNPQPIALYAIVEQLRDITSDFYGFKPSLSPDIAENLSILFKAVNRKQQFLNMRPEFEIGGHLYLLPETRPLIASVRKAIDEDLKAN